MRAGKMQPAGQGVAVDGVVVETVGDPGEEHREGVGRIHVPEPASVGWAVA
jgi:hypothetical protein